MPPVTLIQVGDVYCVRDEHHRTAVARLRGCEVIESEVTVWNTSNVPMCADNDLAAAAISNDQWRRRDEPVFVP